MEYLGDLYVYKGMSILSWAFKRMQSIVESVKQGFFKRFMKTYKLTALWVLLEVYHMILDRLRKKCRKCVGICC